MPFDFVREYQKLKNAYVRERGADSPIGIRHKRQGFPLVQPTKAVPRTTWGDVLLVHQHLLKLADPTQEQCIELLRKKGKSQAEAITICLMGGRDINPSNFVRTTEYNRAKRDFEGEHPAQRTGNGNFLSGMSKVLQKIPQDEVYPYNEEFWGYASQFAQWRSAAGAVPYWDEIAIESIQEAVEELPDTLKAAGAAAFSAVDPRKLIPDVSGFANLIKWGSVGGGLFLLYWYVLRPQKS